jgi:hypothetical protein
VFHLSHVHPSFSSVVGDCTVTSHASYDVSSGHQLAIFDHDDFVSSSICNATIDPLSLGYLPLYSLPSFNLVTDVSTFADSVGINSGYLPVVELPIVYGLQDSNSTIPVNGYVYQADYYEDPYYAGMSAMYCVYNANQSQSNAVFTSPPIAPVTLSGGGVNQLCAADIGGGVLGLPIFLHYGAGGANISASTNSPKPCFW